MRTQTYYLPTHPCISISDVLSYLTQQIEAYGGVINTVRHKDGGVELPLRPPKPSRPTLVHAIKVMCAGGEGQGGGGGGGGAHVASEQQRTCMPAWKWYREVSLLYPHAPLQLHEYVQTDGGSRMDGHVTFFCAVINTRIDFFG